MKRKKKLHHLILLKPLHPKVNAIQSQLNQPLLSRVEEDIPVVATTEAEEDEEEMLESILLLTNVSQNAMQQAQKSVTTSNTEAKELVTTADFGQELAELVAGDKEELIPTSTKEIQRSSKTLTGKSNGNIPVALVEPEVTTKISDITCQKTNVKPDVTKLVQRFAINLNLAEATFEVLAEHGLVLAEKPAGLTLISMSELVVSTKSETAQRELLNASRLLMEPNMPNTTIGM